MPGTVQLAYLAHFQLGSLPWAQYDTEQVGRQAQSPPKSRIPLVRDHTVCYRIRDGEQACVKRGRKVAVEGAAQNECRIDRAAPVRVGRFSANAGPRVRDYLA